MKIFPKVLYFALALIVAILVIVCRPWFERSGFFIYDTFQQFNHADHADQVAIIALDQYSIDQLSKSDGLSYPWPREVYGAVNAMAKKFEAKVVFYDFLFTEPSSYGVNDDLAFAQQILEAGVPTFFPSASAGLSIKTAVEPLRKVAKGLGAVHFPSSEDGLYRHLTPFQRCQQACLSIGHLLATTLGVNDFEDGHLIYYYNRPFTSISFYKLLQVYRLSERGNGLTEEEHQFYREVQAKLKGKVLMVGATAPGLRDLRPTPVDRQAPGVMVHGTVLSNLLAGHRIILSTWTVYGIITFFASIVLLLFANGLQRPMPAIFWSSLWTLLFPFLSSSGLWIFHYWLNPIPLFFGLLTLMVATLIWRFQREWLEQMRMSKSLEHTMSKEMLDLVKHGGFDTVSGHQRREVTVLFSDIADFTSISETLPADQLASLLNQYFDEVINLIFEHHGYVDKFIGDAVMAVWGAPLEQANHRALALQVACKYQQCLVKLNGHLKEIDPSLPSLQARVGVHSGEVIAGNIGSSRRFNYTFIGDTVNLASRLESMSKKYHLHLLFSGECLRDTSVDFATDFVPLLIDRIAVKGKSESTEVFTLVRDCADAELYRQAFTLYQEMNFRQAMSIFEAISSIAAAEVMAKRCKIIVDGGIPDNLKQGVWSYDSK